MQRRTDKVTLDRLVRVNRVLHHARRSDFYRDRLPIAPLQSAEDLARLPFTTKDDLRRQRPGALLSVAERELVQYCESSATTGVPVSVWYSRRDLAEIREKLAGWG